MAEPAHTYTRLPGRLRSELGIPKLEQNGLRRSNDRPRKRKEQRKISRIEKRNKHVSAKKKVPERILPQQAQSESRKSNVIIKKPQKSILKPPKAQTNPPPPPSPPRKILPPMKKKWSKEDTEIAALERALKIKNPAKLPKSFEEDGLDGLLADLDNDDVAPGTSLGKRQRLEGHEWLEEKRRKAQVAADLESISSGAENSEQGDLPFDEPYESDNSGEGADNSRGSFDGFGEDESTSENQGHSRLSQAVKQRENPYVAPQTASSEVAAAKYVPPSLRTKLSSQTEELSRLRKQVQGLINRLSEANMLSIVGDIEKLYLQNPRQDVSTTILDVLIGLLSDPSTLQDTFLILHGGFIAAIYKTIGTEFGAQAIQRIDAEFSLHYERCKSTGCSDKRSLNLINLVSALYNLQVFSSVLIYDLIRQFLSELSELNTELLLRIIRSSGPQLRHDDPSSLKAIVHSLQCQVTDAGEANFSTKMKFMMETMNDLKNNRMKTGIAASSVTSEHMIHMKKILGTLHQRPLKATEPLQISLKDLREADRRGKWWLIGSSYKGNNQDPADREVVTREEADENGTGDGETTDFLVSTNNNLLQLAKEQRMNTSIRQAIFIAVMSATDYNDAYLRLMKLRLKKSQELEIPKVIVHCARSEEVYNPYYALLARKLCSDRRLKMAFQFSLWEVFKQLGHDTSEFEGEYQDEDTKLSLRALVNLARAFGGLIADGGLGLGVLKNLNMTYLQPNLQTFVEVLLTTIMLQAGKTVDEASREQQLMVVFTAPTEMPDMARGLHYFIKKYVSRSDVTGDRRDKEVIKWGCRVAGKILNDIMSKTAYDT